jgi:hypothetical protein
MAQWNKTNQDYLNQERSLFEVFMRADRFGNICDCNSSSSSSGISGSGSFSTDLFGRVKVSNPVTLFDSSHVYYQNSDFDDVVVGSGSTVGFITAQSSATLGIGTTANCRLVRQSKRAFSYQPGKSLQVLQTFVLNPPKENLVQRVGYGSSTNGIFLEQIGSQINIIKRTSVSGTLTTITVPQSEWNVDRLDGTGISTDNPSGVSLDLTKAQILFSEYEWLGVGSVRVGFAIDGNFITAHQFNHANRTDSVYMTSATLPIRYEIENIGITTSSSLMKQICANVLSNGGYERKKAENVARRTEGTEVGTSFEPLVSIRLKPGREFAIVIPQQILAFPLNNNASYEVALIKNGTLTGAAFTSIPNSETENVEYDITASTMTGGDIVNLRYVYGSNQAGGIITADQGYNWDLQLGVTQAGVSDIYTVAARSLSGSADITGAIGFYDLT